VNEPLSLPLRKLKTGPTYLSRIFFSRPKAKILWVLRKDNYGVEKIGWKSLLGTVFTTLHFIPN